MDESHFTDTVPWPSRRQPEAPHAASEYEDETDDGGPEMLGRLLVYSVLVVACLALLVILSP
jgi:hypothetical protein